MHKTTTKTLLAQASIMVFALSLATAAGAQTAEKKQSALDRLGEDIVVTATKKKDVENVQEVPLSVTAFNTSSLETLKVREIESLSYSSPNVSLDQIGTVRGTANFSIRGLGINSSIPSVDPTVGIFVDGVYLGTNNGVVFDLFDTESVEILRGPQGILFGRNTTGGAVLINTGNPTDTLKGKFRLSYDGPLGAGGRNTIAQGAVSGPLIDSILTAKLGVYYNKDSGYFIDSVDGKQHGKAETFIVRGALQLKPSDDFRLLAKVEYFDSNGQGPSAQNRGYYERDTFNFSIDEKGDYKTDTLFIMARADKDVSFGDGTITNIFGYRKNEYTATSDIDATQYYIFHSSVKLDQDQISNELRYAGSFDVGGMGTLDLTAGGYFFRQNVSYDEIRNIPVATPLTFYGGGKQKHTVLGLFSQFDLNISESFTLAAGIRWSKEKKDAQVTYVRPRPECSIVAGTCPFTGTNPYIPTENNGFTDKKSWSNITPKLGFQYKFTPDAQVYGSWTRGFRSGGYNFRITNAVAFEDVYTTLGTYYFDEEKVHSFEVGAKYQSEDRKYSLNGALFLTKIKDMQREVNLASASAGTVQHIANTADTTIKGMELEGRMRILPSLILTGNFGWIDAGYDEVLYDISGDGAIDEDDEALKLPRVPKLSYGIGLIAEFDFGQRNGTVLARVNWQHRDKIAYTDNNYGWITKADMVDANITWNTAAEGLKFSIYGKNLLHKVQYGGDTQLPFPGPLATGINATFAEYPAAGTFSPLSKGRLLGVEVSYEF